ncbi:rhodanese-like domain-containing protein [Hymenobacter terricola]|uniref:rhodanese-like domain-containing protein n=1 Tax=Hymenobacter terricola TaxID=2819236 RepID=UPI001B302203|nr:rhodanese-like domain-containing protein [Hymenobacter terricola]
MADITPIELHQRQQAGETPTIIDVREPWEYEEARMPGAQNIPLSSLPEKLDDIDEWKNQEIIVHCKSGNRSASAKAYLTQQGFTNVRNLVGGFQAYMAAGI